MATCPTCRKHYADDVTSCDADGSSLLPDAAFSASDNDLRAGDVVGEYRVEAKLGAGGFGTVYRAEHPVIGKKVAIKVLAREFSAKPDVAARFIDEARAANQIRHRGIIDIFAFGTLPDGRHYFVMELLEGVSLEDQLRANGPMSPQDAIPILRGVSRAVDAAHVSGIAHRDLKPDNVFLVRAEDGVHTKLLDFGVAKLLGNRSGQKTQTGTPIGTPHYMSPEQARGVNVGTRTDVYSFGVMTYQMLTGELPFQGEAVMDILVKHISDKPKPPSAIRPELPAALDAPILHMLEKEPEARPASLTAAVDELSAAWVSVGGAHEISLPSFALSATPSGRLISQETLVGAETEIAPTAKKRSAALIAIAASVVALAVGVGAYFVVAPRREPVKVPAVADSHGTTSALAPATTSAAASASASVAPQATEVELTIDSTPPHAEVFDGAKKLGTAPGPIHLARATGTRKLTFKATGFAPRETEVDTSSNGTISIALTANAQQGTKPAGTKHTTSSELEAPSF